ncbi:bifunctional phosphopantothenoylcysteine decarboxylase/phosphopantothenate--cysteine ligase CoaBC [Fructilactobacillus carniphilus]|uniref:Coenzyme A biosynthesis bifunctional protein CoaBC n=1 Tax=Fructilactobacillus carniphilus TaxID=2940297 RepID=A0ABY5BZ75_9LACO|nr:bifunctional phosphopantothenoylcysteine decarboxylase/phosphopantothenate--cysteine ligase CoaBC [Fructilactobacillus carniphilus]USS91140.1 bifunctional phosphopantothenoylcysteine decarboxylase/phosphopantothenate--cysteine ligase CoaBC [Fructilactobacillus carniphilus]
MNGKKITLYITGSIAAYKAVYLLRLLIKAGAEVHVVMTAAATRFVTPLTFQTLSQHPVLTDADWEQTGVVHIEAAQWGDVNVVVPASADFIAKAVTGIADSLATTTFLAAPAPKLVVPAMNDGMWNNPATQRNLQQLRQDGIHTVSPDSGFLAEGYAAKGRMPEPEIIKTEIEKLFTNKQDWQGKRVLITAGGTREDLDPVRYLSNRSSGKMGYALARAARAHGAEVTLISANVTLPTPPGVQLVRVRTAQDLAAQLQTLFPQTDVLLMAAAVSDFRPAQVAPQKIKKAAEDAHLTLELEANPDLLKLVATQKKPGQLVVGFAAETQDLKQNAARKLVNKKADFIILNDVGNPQIGFNADDNQVTIIGANGFETQTPVESKAAIAERILAVLKKTFN